MKTKIEIPSEPIVLEQAAHHIDGYRQRAGEALERVQKVVAAYKAIGIGELTQAELKRMIKEGPEALVREKIAGTDPVQIGALKLASEKVKQLVEIPDLHELSNELDKVQELQRREARNPGPNALDAVVIVEGMAIANDEQIRRVETGHTTYAETEAEKEAYLYLREVADILDYLTDKYGTTFLDGVLTQQHKWTPGGGYETKINFGYLKGKVNRSRGR
ncbi:hypothetical protein [Pontibacter liquoris]|uniref:hypothetical protein n=1 Tax=Pontibacter liquoris TaxID=2905677 RepID=UPI001FA7D5C3|nr:hypothetical protein [Pontibacter liquoris]